MSARVADYFCESGRCNIFCAAVILFNIHESAETIPFPIRFPRDIRRFYIMNCNSCCSGNNCLWILILALVLSNKNICLENILNGCGLPLIVALLYCMCKNGSLSSIANSLFGNSCGC